MIWSDKTVPTLASGGRFGYSDDGQTANTLHVSYGFDDCELHANPSTESFVSDPEADAMLTRQHRAPFIVPMKV